MNKRSSPAVEGDRAERKQDDHDRKENVGGETGMPSSKRARSDSASREVVEAAQAAPRVSARSVAPDAFDPENAFFDRVQHAALHPMVTHFFHMTPENLVTRYCRVKPNVNAEFLLKLLKTPPKIFHWGGSDLVKVADAQGDNKLLLLENHSCPSGQRCMPQEGSNSEDHSDGYHVLMRSCFKALVTTKRESLPDGALAVVYDRNSMEANAYAAAMASVFDEPVWLTEYVYGEADPAVRFVDGVMQVRDAAANWHPVRAALRYCALALCVP
jgi:hypothetical protein